MACQGFQRDKTRLLALAPLRSHPLLETAFQQRASVGVCRAPQSRLVSRLDPTVEAQQVYLRALQVEEEGTAGGRLEASALRAERVAKMNQVVSQVAERLPLVA